MGAGEAAATGSSLHLVHVAEHAASERNRAALEAARHAVRERNSSVRVDTEIVRGRSSSILIELSTSASMIVVGSVGIGAVAEMLLGSTATTVASGSICPVAIVRGSMRSDADDWGPVVVAIPPAGRVDGVLAAAFDEAALRDVDLSVVRTGAARLFGLPSPTTITAIDEGADSMLAALRRKHPKVRAHSVLVEGFVVAYLLQSSDTAQLLVVGRTLGGGERPAHLDLISHAMVRQAKCPVLVVPDNRT
ncbi:universal stress protein [Antrihabitans sp. YC3-6]|uniref:Universal stress protein n=1 Tax=Antrihabitans stalagmiti TaxID=2799499 RepID=A0A934NU21_9NOCA|nr:universal stress protein [Antrihabitans stalagmiti]MBJ8341305.1 universal stress protein [Antrihabitans stalagmiti]